MIPIGGLAFLLICVFGGYLLAGGSMAVIMKSLPLEMLIIGGSALGAFAMANSMHVMKASLAGIT